MAPRRKQVDWLAALDFQQATANVEGDLVGDWYVDPWGWPELKWLADPAREKTLRSVARRRTPGALARLDVPKENFGVRPAVVMHVADRLVYQALVDRLSKKLIGELRPTVFNWRLERQTPEAGRYLKSTEEWTRFREWLARSLDQIPFCWLLQTDVVSCFARIAVDLVRDTIDARTESSPIGEKLLRWLDAWARTPGRSGLPQRSRASAVLANAVLQPIDDVLARAPAGGRWMDDVYVFVGDEAEARHLQMRLSEVVRGLGLELNTAKTKVHSMFGAAEEVHEIELKAIDYALIDGQDPEPLHARLEKILADPSAQPKTVLSFMCSRIIQHDLTDEAERLLTIADRAPHAADHFARMVQMMDLAETREEWFVDYFNSKYAAVRWAPGRMLLMFSPGRRPHQSLVDLVVSATSDQASGLVLLAGAATRLTGWLGKDAIDVLRAAADRCDVALEARILALAALAAGESKGRVSQVLGRFDDLATTSAFLKDADYRVPKLHKSFAENEAAD